MTNPRYTKSVEMFERAKCSIPLASQTFSKSFMQYPVGSSPLFLEKGLGARVWDIDGNEYLDFVNGLLCVLLGYQDPDVDANVKKQLAKGVSFTLPHTLETQVAEAIIDMVPCAEMVRFGKNGSDATAGAIRLARCITQKDYVVVCGYHGWQDWYIGSTTRDAGVPRVTKELTLKFEYNNIESLKKLFKEYPNQIAAVIMEPMNFEFPEDDFLQQVKDLTHDNKALLIFDEIITGFRYSNGGAQTLLGVTPDLATFGKGVANGYPLSILCGRKDYMQVMEEVFFSFTFGGETLSLAAAQAVLHKLKTQPVLDSIAKLGELLRKGVSELIGYHQLQSTLSVKGHPSWTLLSIHPNGGGDSRAISSFLSQELFAHGIISLGTHNLSYAHSLEDIETLMATYDVIFAKLKQHLNQDTLTDALQAPMIQEVFKVREST